MSRGFTPEPSALVGSTAQPVTRVRPWTTAPGPGAVIATRKSVGVWKSPIATGATIAPRLPRMTNVAKAAVPMRHIVEGLLVGGLAVRGELLGYLPHRPARNPGSARHLDGRQAVAGL